jgi:hypothetical protein
MVMGFGMFGLGSVLVWLSGDFLKEFTELFSISIFSRPEELLRLLEIYLPSFSSWTLLYHIPFGSFL